MADDKDDDNKRPMQTAANVKVDVVCCLLAISYSTSCITARRRTNNRYVDIRSNNLTKIQYQVMNKIEKS